MPHQKLTIPGAHDPWALNDLCSTEETVNAQTDLAPLHMSPVTGSYGKFLIPVTEISVAKTCFSYENTEIFRQKGKTRREPASPVDRAYVKRSLG